MDTNTKPARVDEKPGTKLRLMAAWASLMCLYLYCDFFSLFRPGQLGSMQGGRIGFMEVSQSSLFFAALLMALPSLMIFVSVVARARLGRILNLAASVAYFLVNVGNLVGEGWAYYFAYGLLELAMVTYIFITSLRWPLARPAA